MAYSTTKNNNPGNIRGKDGNFLTFKTPLEGQIAMYNDLTGKISGNTKTGLNGDSTLYQLISKWAPAADKNDPAGYTAFVANKLGVSPDTKIATLLPRIDDLAHAMSIREGYKGEWKSGNKQDSINTLNPILGNLGGSGNSTAEDQQKIFGETIVKGEDNTKDNPVPAGSENQANPKSAILEGLKNTGKGIFNVATNLTGTKEVGGALSSALIPHLKSVKEAQKAQQASDDMLQKIALAIKENKKIGKDTSRLEDFYRRESGKGFDYNEINPNASMSNKEAALGIAKLGTTILGAGTYGNAGKAGQFGKLVNESPTMVKVLKESTPLIKKVSPVVKTLTGGKGLLGNAIRFAIANHLVTKATNGKISANGLFKDFIE